MNARAQGPLPPPEGPPVPGMKTLEQIEPRTPLVAGSAGVAIAASGTITISLPGSYFLTGNLAVTTGHGIVIAADEVSLDLGGFAITSAAATSTGTGIFLSGKRSRLSISNGFIRGGAAYALPPGAVVGPGFSNGIWTDAASPDGVRVSAISVNGVSGHGIHLGTTSSCIVQGCNVNQAGLLGIRAGIISDSSATMIGGFDAGITMVAERTSNCMGTLAGGGAPPGISQSIPSAEEAATKALAAAIPKRIPLSNETTPGNATCQFRITASGSYFLPNNVTGPTGKSGIEIAASRVTIDLSGFTLAGTAGSLDGIRAAGMSEIKIRDGTITGFSQDGIDLRQGDIDSTISLIEAITVSNNADNGIATNTSATVLNCQASGNGDSGFWIWNHSRIEKCIAYRNAFDGIRATVGSAITGNTCTENTLNGIQTASSCHILHNQCSGNGRNGTGNGIRCTGSWNQVEGNYCELADGGIRIEMGANVIIRNSCHNNTLNWSISTLNTYAAIVDRTSGSPATVSGNSAASTLGTTEPDANITH